MVIEVDRPDRKTRRQRGESDPIDAYAAATAVLSGAATGTPKSRDGRVEAIRTLRVARRSAIKGRTQAINQLKALVLTGPAELRQALAGQSTRQLLLTCRRLRVTARLTEAVDPITAATKVTLRRLARRIATGSTAAATGTPTTHCTSSPWSGCHLTSRPRTTPPADEPKG